MARALTITLLGAICFLLPSCSVGQRHKSDALLEQVFRQHQAEFQGFLAELQMDRLLTTIETGILIYGGRRFEMTETNYADIERLGLPRARLAMYQKQLQDLGLAGVTQSEKGIEFRVDQGSLFNGDSYKGYWYLPSPPLHVLASLDKYRFAERDINTSDGGSLVFKPIGDGWYLYLFISR